VHAACYRLTPSIAFVRASAWQDDEAAPVAVSQSTFMRGPAPGAR
jgi:acyl-coenzyme A thioesterase PaaI-like protein